ncbi:alpha/beta fold hydrolase [Microbacterium sediminis]|uniref:Alpha/beta hydrolase n=1 Tax=Microbacterium sediminis TaxID=904291 RepID=A0A1B9NI37_9MICO|nr:alpha/beta hydrolase [Microbacterium sediminis]OCG76234.1 alpha/beta hydrolase [Microbacterium sediminis]QBR73400.1 alpha/beta hydrolase [Microbacterium sediminis]
MPFPAAEPPARPFTHDGATLVWEERGAGAATFLLIHGIGMGRSVFAGLAERLSHHGRVIAIDLPGYGEAPEPPRTPTVERLADLVAAFVRAERVSEPVIVGHSMGTQVAVEVAARHPALRPRVVLIGPTVEAGRRRAFTQLRLLGADLLGESLKVLLIGAREYLRAGPHLRQKMRAMLTHAPERAYPRVERPALVIRGEDDLVAPHDWCRRVADTLPHGELREVPRSGHETMIRDPDPSADLIVDWLRRA